MLTEYHVYNTIIEIRRIDSINTVIPASNSTFPLFTVKFRNSTLGLWKISLSEPVLTLPSFSCYLVQIETGDLGDVYKIRVSCDDVPGFKGWHLKSFHLQELHTKQELNFECNCWLVLKKEDKELVKEFPAVTGGQKTFPVYKYVVSVHIGDRWGAETFANVYLTLYGKRGDTGVRKLHTSLTKGRKFQRNKVDSFLVEAVSLSHLQKVVIGHDGEGYGAGMYLKMVTVKESPDSDKEWVFPLWNWLDTHLGLCETVCEIVTV
ncbi:LOXH1 protein, partial [Leucopsar rothschildi]|nr:LOXH1 protein [Leucopsar rothschildi]